MRESTSSRLHLAPCERKKITLKLLPWWKKRELWLMYFSRGGINSMNDWKAGVGWGGVFKKRTFVWENYFLLLRNKSAIWQQWTKQRFPCQEMWLIQHSTLNYFRCVHRKRQQMSSDSEIICSIKSGDFIRLSTSKMSIWKRDLVSYSATTFMTSVEQVTKTK